VNEIEEKIDFEIQQIAGSNQLGVKLKNNSEETIELQYHHYSYCSFTYLKYQFVEDDIYRRLYWDDNLEEWNLEGTGIFAMCEADMPPIIIQSNESLIDTVNVKLVTGNIHIKIVFNFASDKKNIETLFKIIEYEKY